MRSAMVIVVMCLALLAGCAVGPNYQPPKPDTASQWSSPLAGGETNGPASLATWWKNSHRTRHHQFRCCRNGRRSKCSAATARRWTSAKRHEPQCRCNRINSTLNVITTAAPTPRINSLRASKPRAIAMPISLAWVATALPFDDPKIPTTTLMKTKTNPKTTASVLQVNENVSLEEQIAQRAHELWRHHGCKYGSDLTDWFQAEREIDEWHQRRLKTKIL